MPKISLCIELFFSTDTPPQKCSKKITKNPFLVKETCQQILKKKCLLKDRLLSHKKNTVHRRRGVWRILMNYIQPNAGQTTHSIYTLIQDGAQYVPLKCRKARREFYWTKKNGGWLRYFNVSRRISSSFLLLLWKSDGVFEKKKSNGCCTLCMYNYV